MSILKNIIGILVDNAELIFLTRYDEENMSTPRVTKDEKGKLKLSYVPASLEREVAKVREFASQKYGGPETWRENSKEQYFDALLRHVNAMRELGLDAIDSESGCTHAAHVACNAAFIIDMLEKNIQEKKHNEV